MAESILRVTTESTWGSPSDVAPRVWELMQEDDGTYWIGHTRQRDDGRPVAERRMVNDAAVRALLERLKKLRVRPAPHFPMGCDGGFTELEIGGYGGQSHFRWWSVPPKGWAALDLIASDVISLFSGGGEVEPT